MPRHTRNVQGAVLRAARQQYSSSTVVRPTHPEPLSCQCAEAAQWLHRWQAGQVWLDEGGRRLRGRQRTHLLNQLTQTVCVGGGTREMGCKKCEYVHEV